MKTIVQKFGGTSVSTQEKREEAARRVISAWHQGYAPVVVVSAIGRRGEPYATDTLIDLAKQIDRDTPIAARELDLLTACGEIISTVLMAHTIKCLGGMDTVALTGGQAGIHTDYEFGNARIIRLEGRYIQDSLMQNRVVVVAGFQGVTVRTARRGHGAITTLGRGGSDTTACALGAVLKAERVEIYTDVEGVMTGDPRLVSAQKVKTLEHVSYPEMCEMAHLGAKVVQARAALIAMRRRLPLWIKSPSSESPGTEVVRPRQIGSVKLPVVTAIANSPVVSRVLIEVPRGCDAAQLEMDVYRALKEAEVSVHFVSRSRSHIEFATEGDDVEKVRQMFDGLFLPESPESSRQQAFLLCVDPRSPFYKTQQNILGRVVGKTRVVEVPVSISGDCSIVSLVFASSPSKAALAADCLDALSGAAVKVLQTGDSDHAISFLVNQEDTRRAVNALHDLLRASVMSSRWLMTDGTTFS